MGDHSSGVPTDPSQNTAKAIAQLVLIGLLLGGLVTLGWIEWPMITGQ